VSTLHNKIVYLTGKEINKLTTYIHLEQVYYHKVEQNADESLIMMKRQDGKRDIITSEHVRCVTKASM